MKNTALLVCFMLLASALFAQSPIITNAENFSIGNEFHYQNCKPDSVWVGTTGPNQTWDFTGLPLLANDTLVDWIVAPSSTPYDSLFPGADFCIESSDGRWSFIHKTPTDNYVVGYVDDNNAITLHYDNYNRVIHRPLDASTNLIDTFTDHFTYTPYNLSGSGITNVISEGWGTLKLPNGIYNNVLKVHVAQVQNDTIIQLQALTASTWDTWLWYDTTHKEAILKIDSMENQAFTFKSVSYLLREKTTGVKEIMPCSNELVVYPNPVSGEFTIANLNEGLLIVTDLQGKIIVNIKVPKDEKKQVISTRNWCSGVYFISMVSPTGIMTRKLCVE
jgi:hypothetical protein